MLGLYLLLFLTRRAIAVHLFVASYAGTLSTLSLSKQSTGSFALEVIASSPACASNTSWITLDRRQDLLYCTGRGYNTPNGTLNSLKIHQNGTLTPLDSILTPVGAVSSTLYADGEALAVAYYSSSSMGSFDLKTPMELGPLQYFQYNLTAPGKDPLYETAPHPHEAITDPTRRYVLIPDLGADMIRIYHIDPDTKLLSAIAPLIGPVGSGPRHAAWLVAKHKTYLFVVSQLTNVLTSYLVTYNDNETLSFTPLYEQSLLKTLTSTDLQYYSAAAEVAVTPDKKGLIVSQRNDTFFSIPDPSGNSNDKILSDSLLTFSLDHSSGNFSLTGIEPAGGSFPRQFSINNAGTLVAVGLQNDGRVVIIKRDVQSGRLQNIVASVDIAGEVVCVIWDE